MSDVSTLTVALEKGVSEEGAERLCRAIGMMQGVIAVEANISNPSDWAARMNARHEVIDKLVALIRELQ